MVDSSGNSISSFIAGVFGNLRRVRGNLSQVLSMNQRNLNYIYPNNQREDYPLADNKLITKQLLEHEGVALPETYKVYGYFYELKKLASDLAEHNDFVIKPAMGSGGGGIVVISGRDKNNQDFLAIDGTPYSIEDLRKHISDIIFGIYSFGLHDEAIIEARIQQHPDIDLISPYGLADVRIIFCQHEPILAMIRLATKESHGTANLHQGAVGVGINIEVGVTQHATQEGKSITTHPDSGVPLIGVILPCWGDVMDVGIRIARKSPLKYIGIDIAISTDGPRLLEINVRPGIEIQNANDCGMRVILEKAVRK